MRSRNLSKDKLYSSDQKIESRKYYAKIICPNLYAINNLTEEFFKQKQKTFFALKRDI